MAIEKLKKSMDIISALPDSPASPDYTPQALKAKFDESGNIIKNYINDTLIPCILDELANTVLGDGGYKYIPTRVRLASFTKTGEYVFDTDEYESYNGLYDIVLIGGGGGGYVGTVTLGGGGGDASLINGVSLSGRYTVTVGGGGSVGQVGETTSFMSEDGEEYIGIASGGGVGSEYSKIARGSGIYGTDSVYGDGTDDYGKGGDCLTYGKGAVGGAVRDDVKNPSGYGGGGWGEVSGGGGAVFVYGYKRTVD